MAQLVNITKTTEIASLMLDAAIVNRILDPNEAEFTHQLLSWYVDPREFAGRSETVRWPRELSGAELQEGTMSYTTPKVEGDDAGYGTPILYQLDDVEAVGQMMGAKRKLSFRSVWISGLEVTRVIQNTITIVQKRIARDQATLGLSATNIEDHSGVLLTRQIFGRANSNFKDQHPTGPYAAVLTSGQIEALRTDIRSDGASILVGDPSLSDIFTTAGAFVGTLEGVPIFRGEFQPDFDAANDFGYFATIGEGGALGIGNFFTANDLEMGIVNGFMIEIDKDHDLDCWTLWVKAYLAHAITNQENYRGLVTKKLAV